LISKCASKGNVLIDDSLLNIILFHFLQELNRDNFLLIFFIVPVNLWLARILLRSVNRVK
jgi:hypothetical protein